MKNTHISYRKFIPVLLFNIFMKITFSIKNKYIIWKICWWWHSFIIFTSLQTYSLLRANIHFIFLFYRIFLMKMFFHCFFKRKSFSQKNINKLTISVYSGYVSPIESSNNIDHDLSLIIVGRYNSHKCTISCFVR